MMKRNEHGFTLVEIMVALVVTALMLTAVYQTVSSASIARERLAIENGRYHMARVVTDRIGRELQSLHYSATDSRTELRGGLTGSDREMISFASTASTPLAKQPGLPARITYNLEETVEEGETYYTLNRTESGVLAIDGGRAYKLADHLTGVDIRFLGNGRWVDSWDSGAMRSLPQAIQLTLTLGQEDDRNVFRTVWQIGDF